MAYVNQIQIPTQNKYDIHASGIPYAQVDSTSTSTDFTATVPGITSLEDGTCVLLKNGQVTSASGFTININGLGDKPVYSNLATGNDITPTDPTRDTTIFNINYTMLFIYSSTIVDGGGWICYRGYDANTNTIGYQLRTNSGNLEASDTGYKYRLWFTSADGTKWVPANTSTSTNATTARTMNTRPINPFGPIVYNSTNGTTNANARPTAANLWQQYTLTVGYSYVVSLTAYDSVYVQCTPQTNGSAVMNAIVKALPTSNDGKIYIYLGIAYSTTSMELRMEHPVFYHDGNGIKVWTGTKIPSKTSDLTNDSNFVEDASYVHTDNNFTTTLKNKLDAMSTVDNNTTYTLSISTGSNSTAHLVSGSSTIANITIPNTTNTTYGLATTAANGLMSSYMYQALIHNAVGADESGISGKNATDGYQIHLDLANLYTEDYLLEDYTTIPAATTATFGVVKPNGTASYYLNGTGGWTVPPNTTYTTATTAANGLMSAADKKKLDACSTVDNNTTYTLTVSTAANSTIHLVSGSSTVANITVPNTTNTTYNTFSTGSNGLVPKPSSNSTNVYLNANGSWTIPVDNDTTYSVFNSTKDGLVPKPTTGQSASGYYLSGQGTWESFAADLDFYGTTATNKYTVTLDNVDTGDSMDADIPLATSAVAGVVKPNGTSTHYLNGTGGWTAPPNATYTLTGTTSTSDYKVALSGANAATATIPLATSARAGLVKPDGTSTHCLNGTGGWSAFNNYTHPSYTAATGAPTSNQTPTFGGTFSVNQVNRDSTGHVSVLTNRTITIPNSTFTTSANGLVPKPTSAATNTFLNSCGTWTTPESGTVMTAMTTAEVQSAVQNGWGSIVNGNNIGF